MTEDPIRTAIRDFLDLVEGTSGSTTENEQALVLLLDRLALVTHAPEPSDAGSDVEAPRHAYEAMHAQVVARFPRYGLYRAGSPEPDDVFLVGDAIDDIADIAIDLSEVAWLWDRVGEVEALWLFHFGFTHHWGSHLRSLQWYVHEMRGQDDDR